MTYEEFVWYYFVTWLSSMIVVFLAIELLGRTKSGVMPFSQVDSLMKHLGEDKEWLPRFIASTENLSMFWFSFNRLIEVELPTGDVKKIVRKGYLGYSILEGEDEKDSNLSPRFLYLCYYYDFYLFAFMFMLLFRFTGLIGALFLVIYLFKVMP